MISYVVGDATDPCVPGKRIVVHVCNDIGAWGRGFVLSLSRRWPEAERIYRSWYQNQEDSNEWPPMSLGNTLFVPVEHVGTPPIWARTWVAHMVAQRGIQPEAGVPPIRYDALATCLQDVALMARETGATVHMPRIGCGLAGGRWSEVEQIVQQVLIAVPTYVYDFDASDSRTVPWKP